MRYSSGSRKPQPGAPADHGRVLVRHHVAKDPREQRRRDAGPPEDLEVDDPGGVRVDERDRVVRGERHVRSGAAELRHPLTFGGVDDRPLRRGVELPRRLRVDRTDPALRAGERAVPGRAPPGGLVRDPLHGVVVRHVQRRTAVRPGCRAGELNRHSAHRDRPAGVERGGRRPQRGGGLVVGVEGRIPLVTARGGHGDPEGGRFCQLFVPGGAVDVRKAIGDRDGGQRRIRVRVAERGPQAGRKVSRRARGPTAGTLSRARPR